MKALLTVGGTLLAIAGGAYWFLTKKKAEQPAMGCLESKPAEDVATKAPAAKKAKVETAAPPVSNTAKPAVTAAKKKEEFSWEKKKPDPKDYMFSNLKGQVCIKEPGSIDGQMFIIEVGESQEGTGRASRADFEQDCEDCDIYVCDYTAQVQVHGVKGLVQPQRGLPKALHCALTLVTDRLLQELPHLCRAVGEQHFHPQLRKLSVHHRLPAVPRGESSASRHHLRTMFVLTFSFRFSNPTARVCRLRHASVRLHCARSGVF